MSRNHRGLAGVLIVMTVGLFVVGCSSSKESGSTTTTTVSATTSTSASHSSTTASAATRATAPAGEDPWTVSARDLGGTTGKRYSLVCPPGGTEMATIWGTGVYTDDSGVCVAAVHAGLLTFATGGTVTFDLLPGRDAYTGSEAHGVTSNDYGQWDGSLQFAK